MHLLSAVSTSEGKKRQSGHSSRYDSHCRQRKPVHRTSPPIRALCSLLCLCTLGVHWKRRVRLIVDHFGNSHTHHLYRNCNQSEEQVLAGRSFLRSVRDIAGFHSRSAVRSTDLHTPHQHRKTYHHNGLTHHRHCMVFGWSSLAFGSRGPERQVQ